MWFWFGFGGMVLGSMVIFSFNQRFSSKNKYHAQLALAVTVIAAVSYYGLARGQAEVVVHGSTVYFGRYIDWLLTTPLLLLSLLLIALPHGKEIKITRSQFALIANALFLDVLMIVTGFFASVSQQMFDIVFWYGLSCFALILLVVLMNGEVRRHAYENSHKIGDTYTKLITFLSIAWIFYPILWALGSNGYQYVSFTFEVAAYAILDVSAKAVFGILTLQALSREEERLN